MFARSKLVPELVVTDSYREADIKPRTPPDKPL